MSVFKIWLDDIRAVLPSIRWTTDDRSMSGATAFHGTSDEWRIVLAAWLHGVDGTATNETRGIVLHLPPDLASEALYLAKKQIHDRERGGQG